MSRMVLIHLLLYETCSLLHESPLPFEFDLRQ